MRIGTYVCVMFCLFYFIAACGHGSGPRDMIIGKWVGDPETYATDSEAQKDIDDNLMGELLRVFIDVQLRSMKIEFTKTTLTFNMEVPGEEPKNIHAGYEIVSSTKDSVVIKSADGTGSSMAIRIIDRDHIRLSSEFDGENETEFILKRVDPE